MKIDGDVPTDDSQQENNAAVDESRAAAGQCEDSVESLSSHDLRASLAIVNGFSAALGASFQDLSDQYRQILETDDDELIASSADRLMMLDADCRFCLSRLHTSIDQLKHRIQSDKAIFGDDQPEKPDR